MKKLIMCAVLMLLFCACAEKSGDYTFDIGSDMTAVITGYSGSAQELIIPDTLNGYRVTGIADYVFNRCATITSVVIPVSVETTGANPFLGCGSLTEIYVSPDSPYLATIDGVLFAKNGRRLITYPCAFTDTAYAVPEGVQAIGDGAFFGCESLTSVIIPASVMTVGLNPFPACGSLTDIYVSPDNPFLTVIDGVLFEKNGNRLITYPFAFTDDSYAVPEGTQAIGDAAFYCCSRLRSLVIPDSVTFIGESAFWDCKRLTVTVGRDSFARNYCIENGIKYTYSDIEDWLNAPITPTPTPVPTPSPTPSPTPTPTPAPTPSPAPVKLEYDYFIEVDKGKQIITVYTLGETGYYDLICKQFICSTGKLDKVEDGMYRIGKKYRWKQMGNGSYVQYASSISGPYLFHSCVYYTEKNNQLKQNYYLNLGQKASSGCIRLTAGDACWIYTNCKKGTPIRVFDSGETDDELISSLWHPHLVNINYDPTDPEAPEKYRVTPYPEPTPDPTPAYGVTPAPTPEWTVHPELKAWGYN